MSKTLSIIAIIFTLTIASAKDASAQFFFGSRKTVWTVAEVKQWSEENKKQRWQGLLLYRGSDSTHHHFISRFMDEFVWFDIERSEVKVENEIPYPKKRTSSTPLGYYYVDPLKDFARIHDH